MTKLIVGLGNIGSEYDNTYHNLGFAALDALAGRLSKKIDKRDCSSSVCVFSKNNEKIVLAKPSTYMNLSGIAVKGLMTKYGASPAETIVIFDDIDIPRFAVRARKNGSAGTHNGMKSVLSETNCTEIMRIRIGVGRGLGDLADFVLSRIKEDDRQKFDALLDGIAESLEKFLKDGDFDLLMRSVNHGAQDEK